MEPETPTAERLAEYFLAAQHPITRRWVDDDARLALLADQRSTDVLLATDLSIAFARGRHFAPELPARALLNRWVTVGDGLRAMMSIRYQGLDPEKPFVDAMVLSRPLTAGDLPGLTTAASDAYGEFAPGYLRLWSSAPAGAFPGTSPDKRFLAAPVGLLGRRPAPDGLRLAPATSLDNYDTAREAYADMAAAHPGHPEQARIEERDDLAENLADGTLFDITVDGEWAGYVAVGTDGESLGLPAYIVEELIVATRFRGRGHGSGVTTLLARALPDATRILLGTVHADNRGARKAAERAGRVDVGGWVQVPLPGAGAV